MFNWFKRNCKCNHNVSEVKVNYDEAIDAWHAPILNVGDFVEYHHKPTNKTYFLFVAELTPKFIRLGCGDIELSYKIDGKTNGYDLVNAFIRRKGVKRLF